MCQGFIIVLDKPEKISSNAASVKCRKLLGQKKSGYIGTLDPLATGVLPVFTGKMTKLIPFFEESYKIYEAVFELGKQSPSLDTETEVTAVDFPVTDEYAAKEVINQFIGEQTQIPPAYSAIKSNGVRSYKAAVNNIPISLPPRQINIFYITDIRINLPLIGFTVKTSKGTYIRVLADDIAKKLGTRAVLTKLRRVAHGDYFNINQAVNMNEIEFNDSQKKRVLLLNTIKYIINNLFTFKIDASHIQSISNGKCVLVTNSDNFPMRQSTNSRLEPVIAMSTENTPVAAGYLEYSRDMRLLFHPHKVLL